MRDSDYITILASMVIKLHLSGNRLIIFALIHGFTKDGTHEFSGSLEYISRWTNLSKQSVISTLKALQESGLINKRESVINGVKFCSYTTNYDNLIGSQETLIPIKKLEPGSQETLMGGIQETLPNNNSYNIDNYNTIPPLPPKGKGEVKKKEGFEFGFVLPEYKDAFYEWLEYKKQRRESYKTDRSIKLCYDKLVKLSGNNPTTAKMIVEQSMANNWAGLFELKDYGNNRTSYSKKQEANNYALEQYIRDGERIARGERVHTCDPEDRPF